MRDLRPGDALERTDSREEAHGAGAGSPRLSILRRKLFRFVLFLQPARRLAIRGRVFIIAGLAQVFDLIHMGKIRSCRRGPHHGHRAYGRYRSDVHLSFLPHGTYRQTRRRTLAFSEYRVFGKATDLASLDQQSQPGAGCPRSRCWDLGSDLSLAAQPPLAPSPSPAGPELRSRAAPA